jgi:hypothetical protein
MKRQFSLFLFLTFLATSQFVFGQQTVPKEVFLNTINGVNELKLSNLKTSELMEYNAGYSDKVYDILGSDKSDKDKVSALKVLNNDKEKDLVDLLGNKEFKKYSRLMEESLKPLIKKNKLIKHLL